MNHYTLQIRYSSIDSPNGWSYVRAGEAYGEVEAMELLKNPGLEYMEFINKRHLLALVDDFGFLYAIGRLAGKEILTMGRDGEGDYGAMRLPEVRYTKELMKIRKNSKSGFDWQRYLVVSDPRSLVLHSDRIFKVNPRKLVAACLEVSSSVVASIPKVYLSELNGALQVAERWIAYEATHKEMSDAILSLRVCEIELIATVRTISVKKDAMSAIVESMSLYDQALRSDPIRDVIHVFTGNNPDASVEAIRTGIKQTLLKHINVLDLMENLIL